nr:MAG TPA: helix-turn-helix domain-containing protein [Caudoviricetes sp.]
MKAVLISIQPKRVEKIANGEKTIEVRKTAPKQVPFKAYIFCTKGKYEWLYRVDNNGYGKPQSWHGKVIGEFVCDKVIKTCGWCLRGDTQQCAKRTTAEEAFPKLACLTIDEIVKYAGSENREVCGLHISDLKIYDKPKELSEFRVSCPTSCENCKNPLYYECWCEEKGVKVLTRAPQSWQYVEEL